MRSLLTLLRVRTEQVPIYITNLRQAADRRRYMKRQFSGTGLKPTFVLADNLQDRKYPFFLHKELSGQWWDRFDQFKPGAFGAFLTHSECWHRVAQGTAPYGIILEDDVKFNAWAVCRLLDDIRELTFDIVYLNDRIQAWAKNEEHPVGKKTVEVGSLLYSLLINGTYSKQVPPPGADGYLVSKLGALKLLYMMHSKGINMGPDYAMALNTLSQQHRDSLRKMPAEQLPFSVRCLLHNDAHRHNPKHFVRMDSYIYLPECLASQNHSISYPGTVKHDLFFPNELFDAKPSGLSLRHRFAATDGD